MVNDVVLDEALYLIWKFEMHVERKPQKEDVLLFRSKAVADAIKQLEKGNEMRKK